MQSTVPGYDVADNFVPQRLVGHVLGACMRRATSVLDLLDNVSRRFDVDIAYKHRGILFGETPGGRCAQTGAGACNERYFSV
jgi:hypothetical protein